jgi:hypothetical protein
MTRGVLIFAHNGKIDYGTQAVLSCRYAKKHLGVPVSLVADSATVDKVDVDFGLGDFDKVILDDVQVTNLRTLRNGTEVELVEFKNGNRSDAYSLTPYDQTLVIDSDLLICNSSLNEFWESGYNFSIAAGSYDPATVAEIPTGYTVSKYSIRMLWATMFMFTKSDEVETLFDLVTTIRSNYNYYAQLFEFDASKFRNDYVFSIACHMLSGCTGDKWFGQLPHPVLLKETDQLVKVHNDNEFTLMSRDNASGDYFLTRVQDQNLHFINKRNMLENFTELNGALK